MNNNNNNNLNQNQQDLDSDGDTVVNKELHGTMEKNL